MRLQYVLVVQDAKSDSDATLFQGWNHGIVTPEFMDLIHLVCCLPSDMHELAMTQEELIAFRRAHIGKDAKVVGAHVLSKIRFSMPESVTIYVCLPEQIATVKATQIKSDSPVLILSPFKEDGVIDIRNFKTPVCQSLDPNLWPHCAPEWRERRTIRAEYDSMFRLPILHGIIQPSLTVLENLGFRTEGKTGVLLHDHQEAIDLVAAVAIQVIDLINNNDDSDVEVIVYAPAMKTSFYDSKSITWNHLLRNVKAKWKKGLVESMMFQNRSYSGIQFEADEEEFENPLHDQYAGPILQTRLSEIYATSMAISLMATVDFAPGVRLPNAVNLHQSQLRHIESLAKRTDVKAEKLLQKAFRSYVNDLKADIGGKLLKLIEERATACKICSDVPLEWIYLDRLPLMISHEVSKVPMTPGNSVLQFAATGSPVVLKSSDLQKVLVIRSFRVDDRIRNMLEFAVKQFQLSDQMEVEFVDVTSEAEAVTALNNFTGFIVVFDCHGSHGGADNEGWLHFGSDRTCTWNLASIARIPPIAILSACSTSPIGGSHASVAGGLLRSGALSAIGTFLPVDGIKASAFVARLLYRIDVFLPILQSLGTRMITWRSFVAGFLQMSYVTDVLHFFESKDLIDDAMYRAIHYEANERINLQEQNWYDLILARVAESSGVSEPRLAEMIVGENPLFETMRYCQLGIPERIYIFLDTVSSEG